MLREKCFSQTHQLWLHGDHEVETTRIQKLKVEKQLQMSVCVCVCVQSAENTAAVFRRQLQVGWLRMSEPVSEGVLVCTRLLPATCKIYLPLHPPRDGERAAAAAAGRISCIKYCPSAAEAVTFSHCSINVSACEC